MKKILLIYWPEEGNVEHISKTIAKKLSDDKVVRRSIIDITPDDLSGFDNWIVGGSTVGSHVWEDADDSNKWNEFFKKLDNLDMKSKTVAFFGLGDQVLYPNHFVDGLGILQEEFEKRETNIIGHWPTDGYSFTDSEGVKDDMFFGLPLNEDQEPELTDERLDAWFEVIFKGFK